MALDRGKVTQQAEKLLAQGKIDQAIAQYEILVRDNPRDMNTINKIGDLYSRMGKKRDAIFQYNKIGEFYAKDGFFLKAIAIYKKIMKLDPSFPDASLKLAELYAKQGLVLEARSQYQVVAQQHLKQGAVKKAIEVYRSMIAMDPADLQLRTTLADLLSGAGNAPEAAEEYTRIGSDLERKGKTKEARAAYHKAASLHPGSAAMAVRVAGTHAVEGDIEGALKIAQDALKKGETADLHVVVAEIHAQAGRPADVVASLERAVTLSPTRMDLTLRLARARMENGERSAALRTLENRADALVKDGKGKEALAAAQEMLGSHPTVKGLRLLLKFSEGMHDASSQLQWGEALVAGLMEADEKEEAARLAERLLSLGAADATVSERLAAARDKARQSMAVEAQPPVDIEPAVSLESMGDSGDGGLRLDPDDEDFITEHMTEADVFMKYGLGERAVEQLQAVVDKYPWYPPAHQKIKEIHLEEGNREGARLAMIRLVRIHIEAGTLPVAEESLQELRRYDPACKEIEALTQALTSGGYEVRPEPGSRPVVEDGPAVEAEAAVPPVDEERVPSTEELKVVDALLKEGKRDQAVNALRRLADLYGSHPEIMGRMKSAMAMSARPAVESATASVGGAAQAVEELEEEFIIDADDAEEEAILEVETSPAPSPPARQNGTEDLMDLASEIDAALGGVTGGTGLITGEEAEPEGHSLEEIVEAFKKGIEQQVSADDYETHYNLAIAYKEMGLLDEAIGEFQCASKDPGLLVDCCSMLGLCFREKKMGTLATRWYRRGLEACNGRDDDASLGLRYDLANLMLEMGERDQALELLTEVYGVNSKFRDVAARLRDLQGAAPA
ncbi:MAG: tetratricopeptide repeat protein [Candidatus Polarisedimenticolia bacterium]